MNLLIEGRTEDQMAALIAAAKSGNDLAGFILRRAGRMFAMGGANVVNIFAPELIILSGERMQYDFLYDDAMIAQMHKSIVQTGFPPPEVHVHKWGNQMWAQDAAAFAIDGVTERAIRLAAVWSVLIAMATCCQSCLSRAEHPQPP